MNGQAPSNPFESLLVFGDSLGIAAADWKKREELEQLTYAVSGVDRQTAASLTLSHLEPLLQAFGHALTCRFFFGAI
jgi:hypothetical protein